MVKKKKNLLEPKLMQIHDQTCLKYEQMTFDIRSTFMDLMPKSPKRHTSSRIEEEDLLRFTAAIKAFLETVQLLAFRDKKKSAATI